MLIKTRKFQILKKSSPEYNDTLCKNVPRWISDKVATFCRFYVMIKSCNRLKSARDPPSSQVGNWSTEKKICVRILLTSCLVKIRRFGCLLSHLAALFKIKYFEIEIQGVLFTFQSLYHKQRGSGNSFDSMKNKEGNCGKWTKFFLKTS